MEEKPQPSCSSSDRPKRRKIPNSKYFGDGMVSSQKKSRKTLKLFMNIFSYYLVLTKRSNSNFDMCSKCLPKLTWASRKPFPSDKLRTTFGQPSDTFCPVQNGIWQLGGPVFPRYVQHTKIVR